MDGNYFFLLLRWKLIQGRLQLYCHWSYIAYQISQLFNDVASLRNPRKFDACTKFAAKCMETHVGYLLCPEAPNIFHMIRMYGVGEVCLQYTGYRKIVSVQHTYGARTRSSGFLDVRASNSARTSAGTMLTMTLDVLYSLVDVSTDKKTLLNMFDEISSYVIEHRVNTLKSSGTYIRQWITP